MQEKELTEIKHLLEDIKSQQQRFEKTKIDLLVNIDNNIKKLLQNQKSS